MTKYKATITIAILVFAMAFSFVAIPTTTVNAQTTTIHDDLLQYEWPFNRGSNAASFASDGPGPDSPNILWKTKIDDLTGAKPVAFNGKVFIQSGKSGKVYALDGATGEIVWTSNATGNVFFGEGIGAGINKIDDTYMLVGTTCLRIADGSLVWNGPEGFYPLSPDSMAGLGYIPEVKMFVDGMSGWSLPDPSKPPTMVWDLYAIQNAGYPMAHAYDPTDGIVLIASLGIEGNIRGVNVTNGAIVWTTPVTSRILFGGSYIDGKFVHGGTDNNMRAWNATTGELIWTYNPGTWYGQWASSTAVAYGMVYEKNQDTYLYAINATTGKLVWKAKGPGVAYSNILTIAGGKVYAQMGDPQYRDFETGEFAKAEFDCYNAYTGELVWSMPMENGPPPSFQCNAYGNLYVIPTVSPSEPGAYSYVGMSGTAGILGEVWCIGNTPKDWSMFRSDPMQTADGRGPTNLSLKWKFPTGGQIISSAALFNGVCYFGSFDRNIYAIDATTGVKIWNFTTGFSVGSSVAVFNGKVYTGADDGDVHCLDAITGSELWKTSAGGVTNLILGWGVMPPVRSSPIVIGGKVYVGALDGNLYCFNANSGSTLWAVQTGGPICATPTVVDDMIYVPSCTQGTDGAFYKIDANSGSILWNLTIPYLLDATPGNGAFLYASATVGEGKVFLRNGFRYNYALNITTGEVLWTYETGYNKASPEEKGGVIQMDAPLYAYGRVYINDYYGVACINATDGKAIWSTWLSREDSTPGLSYSLNRVYAVTALGTVYVLDSNTGEKLSNYNTVNQMFSMPVPYNGSLYVGSCDWNLYCFDEYVAPSIASNDFVLSLSTTSITKGTLFYITGGISNVGRVPATVTLDKPDSTYVDVPLMTDDNGNFMVIYTPEIAGDWTATAWWNGDATHTASASETLSFTVVEPQTPEPTSTPVSLAEQYMLPSVIGIVAAIAVVGALILLQLRKK